MNRRLIVIILTGLLLVFLNENATARNKFKTKEKTKHRYSQGSVGPEVSMSGMKCCQFNTFIGMSVIEGSALFIGAQVGKAISKGIPIFLGPEVNFSLDAPTSLLMVLGSVWKEFRFEKMPNFSLGALSGIDISDRFHGLRRTGFVLLLDLALIQDIDEYVSARGQFRIGTVGSKLALFMNFNVTFRL